MLYRNRKKESKKMAHDFSNEFNLNDPVDRSVAIWRAANIDIDIKDKQSELKWFKDGLRNFYHVTGGKEEGPNGSLVVVDKQGNKTATLDTELIKKLFPVEKYPEYYKKDKTTGEIEKYRQQAVKFTLYNCKA